MFILLAVIVELLLPETSLQKYVKMVIGLLLIAIILSPIFKLFTEDFNAILEGATNAIENDGANNIENSYENQKIEIQVQQNAYILEQTAVQLEESIEKELMDQFNYKVDAIQLEVDEQFTSGDQIDDVISNLSTIHISLTMAAGDHEAVDKVEAVSINLSEQTEVRQEEVDENITHFFAEAWGVNEEMISITIERGNEGG